MGQTKLAVDIIFVWNNGVRASQRKDTQTWKIQKIPPWQTKGLLNHWGAQLSLKYYPCDCNSCGWHANMQMWFWWTFVCMNLINNLLYLHSSPSGCPGWFIRMCGCTPRQWSWPQSRWQPPTDSSLLCCGGRTQQVHRNSESQLYEWVNIWCTCISCHKALAHSQLQLKSVQKWLSNVAVYIPGPQLANHQMHTNNFNIMCSSRQDLFAKVFWGVYVYRFVLKFSN